MIGRCNDRITKSFERQKTISSSNILSECVIMEQIANGDFHLCYSWNKYRGVKMSELLFMLMIILKEGMELLALKRNHLKVKSIRVMLVMTGCLILHLMWRGILSEWPVLLQMLLAGSLICDIIIICSNKLVSNLGGNIK